MGDKNTVRCKLSGSPENVEQNCVVVKFLVTQKAWNQNNEKQISRQTAGLNKNIVFQRFAKLKLTRFSLSQPRGLVGCLVGVLCFTCSCNALRNDSSSWGSWVVPSGDQAHHSGLPGDTEHTPLLTAPPSATSACGKPAFSHRLYYSGYVSHDSTGSSQFIRLISK